VPTIAYIANQFPSPVESYVPAEIRELRGRGVSVIPCSARPPANGLNDELREWAGETLCLQPLKPALLARALWLCVQQFDLLSGLFQRILLQGHESPMRRLRAIAHTWLGACLALRLGEGNVSHIHAHHGYFSSWVAMVAARLLRAGFSMTLHGSDLLVHAAYLDTKLSECRFCLTVSAYNRRRILSQYPDIEPEKIVVQRLGVDPGRLPFPMARAQCQGGRHLLLSVGRLHPIKDHAFLIRACHRLKDQGLKFLCLIAGEGPERQNLEHLIAGLDLKTEVRLLGHVDHETLDLYYAMADVAVLTSLSEGIPLALMEAMAQGKPVLAPAITGIPELIIDGKTGYLYQPGSMEDFVARLTFICASKENLEPLCRAAQCHVFEYFNFEKNLTEFGDRFLARIQHDTEEDAYEDLVLQQI